MLTDKSKTPPDAALLGALHRLTVLVYRTRDLLKASRSVIDAKIVSASGCGMAPVDDGGRLSEGALRRVVSERVLEDGIELRGFEKPLSASLDDLDYVVAKQASAENYRDALLDVQSRLDDAKIGGLLLETPIERHLLETIASSLRAQIIELSHLEQEMSEVFTAAGCEVGVDIEGEVDRIVERFKDQVSDKNRKLKFHRPATIVPLVFMAREDLRQIIVLLIDNGLKYTLDMRGGRPSWIDVKIEEHAGFVELIVESWGCPVFRDEEERVLEPGIRGTAAQRLRIDGNGQGLFSANTLAARFNGSIRIYSEGRPLRASWWPGKRLRTWAILKIPLSPPDQANT